MDKVGTLTPIEITTDPDTKVELFDKDNHLIGSGMTDHTGHLMVLVMLHYTNKTNTNLVDKVGTLTPIEITTDPDTKVELFDKDNHLIGSGMTDHTVTITPSKPLVEGTITAKATDDTLNNHS